MHPELLRALGWATPTERPLSHPTSLSLLFVVQHDEI